jgi:hypothetical protein
MFGEWRRVMSPPMASESPHDEALSSGRSRTQREFGALSAAWQMLRAIIRRDSRPLVGAIAAAGIAASVATYQFAVYSSFLRAGAAAPTHFDAAVWISERGVECFDFPTPFTADYDHSIRAVLPGATVRRLAFGFAPYVAPDGRRGNVAIIAVDDSTLTPRQFIADRSDRARLGLDHGAEASLGGRSFYNAGDVGTLSTFLGAPYVVTGFDDGAQAIGLPVGHTSFLLVDFPNGTPADLPLRLAELERRWPELSARTGADFASSSSYYWQMKTGAGAAILLAAVLAAMLMALLLTGGTARFLQRRQSDLVSLVGHGAGNETLVGLVVGVSALIGVGALIGALVLVPAAIAAGLAYLPWVSAGVGDALFAMVMTSVCTITASIGGVRTIRGVSPDVIFRA